MFFNQKKKRILKTSHRHKTLIHISRKLQWHFVHLQSAANVQKNIMCLNSFMQNIDYSEKKYNTL